MGYDDSTITPEMLEAFLANGKGPLAGKYYPSGSNDPTFLSAIAAIQNGLDDSHVKVGGISGLSLKDNSVAISKIGNLKLLVFSGVAAAGPCTLTGSAVGDVVIDVINLSTPGQANTDFETAITVVDQIQQTSASDLSTAKFAALLVTPLTGANMKLLAFTGHNGAGACTLTGAAVGDTVLNIINLTTPANAEASFEATISVINEIQQSSASDLSAVKFLAFLTS